MDRCRFYNITLHELCEEKRCDIFDKFNFQAQCVRCRRHFIEQRWHDIAQGAWLADRRSPAATSHLRAEHVE